MVQFRDSVDEHVCVVASGCVHVLCCGKDYATGWSPFLDTNGDYNINDICQHLMFNNWSYGEQVLIVCGKYIRLY